jgi:hypothetical protein
MRSWCLATMAPDEVLSCREAANRRRHIDWGRSSAPLQSSDKSCIRSTPWVGIIQKR